MTVGRTLKAMLRGRAYTAGRSRGMAAAVCHRPARLPREGAGRVPVCEICPYFIGFAAWLIA
jgi:hypothetical protein